MSNFVLVDLYLLKHVWKMLFDDTKWFPIHGKVVELLRFVLVYMAHILKTDVHFLLKKIRLNIVY